LPDDEAVNPEDAPTPDPDMPPDPDAEPDDGGSEGRREATRELTVAESEFVVDLVANGCTGYGKTLSSLYRKHFPDRCNICAQQLRKNAHHMWDRANVQLEVERQREIAEEAKKELDNARRAAVFKKADAIANLEVDGLRTLDRAVRTVANIMDPKKSAHPNVPAQAKGILELTMKVTNNLANQEPTVNVNLGSGAAEEITERARKLLGATMAQKGITPFDEEGKA
jgi:hypothetical protein